MTKKTAAGAPPAAPVEPELITPAAAPAPEVETPPAAPVEPDLKAALPASVTLDAPYGFIDDEGVNRYWNAGQVVTNSDDVALLVERLAPISYEAAE